jgi:hypothetical protein
MRDMVRWLEEAQAHRDAARAEADVLAGLLAEATGRAGNIGVGLMGRVDAALAARGK